MNTLTDSPKPILLLVDDDPSVLEALESELTPRFHELCRIEAFRDPAEALQAIQEWQAERRPVALAIVDQRMPGLTGLELIRRMNEGTGAPIGPAIPPTTTRAVLLTGFGGPGVAAEAQAEPGVHRYREKPWRGDVLAHDVQSLLADYWRAARAARDPQVERALGSGLGRLWDQLERAASETLTPDAETAAEDERLRSLLAAALRGAEGSWPSPEALQAFLLGLASAEQLAEIRAAALESASFRREVSHLVGQIGRLSGVEAQLEFDQVRMPESLRRLIESEDDDRSR